MNLMANTAPVCFQLGDHLNARTEEARIAVDMTGNSASEHIIPWYRLLGEKKSMVDIGTAQEVCVKCILHVKIFDGYTKPSHICCESSLFC